MRRHAGANLNARACEQDARHRWQRGLLMADTANERELKRRCDALSRLLEVSLVLNTDLSLEPILKFIMEAACEITGAQAASILLYDRNTDALRFAASNSLGIDVEEMLRIPVPMEGSIAGQIVREDRAILIQDAADDPRIFRSVDDSIGFRTRSLLGVPMRVRGSVIGVLEALNKRDGSWTDDDHTHLDILASHAAVAIRNAQQAEAIQRAYAELDKVDKLKSDFIAVASHELRTPLGVILGYATFLKEDAHGEAGDHAAAVLRSALHLRNLIEDMTNLRFLHQGGLELVREEVPVSALVFAAQHDIQALASAKAHRLEIDLVNADSVVLVDRAKIVTALINILHNAVKFTPEQGLIQVGVERRPREVWIRITDDGIGIAPDQIERIFDQFYQAADHMTRHQGGMGLGLAIARGMVEAHEGRLWAESEGPGKGSSFCMALPLARQAPAM
jgi:signal transduction histidine kinase